jgi:hypothetical protein
VDGYFLEITATSTVVSWSPGIVPLKFALVWAPTLLLSIHTLRIPLSTILLVRNFTFDSRFAKLGGQSCWIGYLDLTPENKHDEVGHWTDGTSTDFSNWSKNCTGRESVCTLCFFLFASFLATRVCS